MMETIIRKLTSRKMWLAIAEFVSMVIVAMGGTESEATKIAALIMAGAGVIAYIVGEGLVDAARSGKTENTVNLKLPETPEEPADFEEEVENG